MNSRDRKALINDARKTLEARYTDPERYSHYYDVMGGGDASPDPKLQATAIAGLYLLMKIMGIDPLDLETVPLVNQKAALVVLASTLDYRTESPPMMSDPCAPCSGTGHVITGKAVLSSDVINYYRRLYHRDLIHVRMNELKDVKTGDETTRGYVDERLRELGDQLKSTIEAQGGEEHYVDELSRLFDERLSIGVCPECIGTGIKMSKEENTHA